MIGMNANIMSKLKPYILVVCLQFGMAGIYVISMATLNRGMSRYVLIVYRNAVAALFLAPFALIFERKTRPKMTLPVAMQIMVLGFLEPVLDQGFGYLGMSYTSASFTSAIMNAVPSITFIIAVVFRMERVNLKRVRGVAKVIGTLVTFAGALVMTLYKGPIVDFFWTRKTNHLVHSASAASAAANQHWVAGTLFILLACVAWSCFYVLQSVTVKRYPAELSLSTLICMAGVVQTTVIAVAFEHRASSWAVGWDSRLLAPLYTGIVGSGITYYFQALVMKTRGPVFVTAFNPLCMVVVTIISSIILAEKIHLGSVIGAIIIAIGLYSVVWGKSKDYSTAAGHLEKSNAAVPELPITASKLPAEQDANELH
ncbi:WAT1-related protein At4g08290-like [Cucurbita pepo subsp. pepo]|uniref:WAT1-related protein At4g08290-like n=1 Tax=Cucurbita pepo subsp. pepo TaxID=3664 RepID=UPI000C9D33BA|nr:WAT1-related protein At4g08290-like [Cucurbita pepo subsp. pepo]